MKKYQMAAGMLLALATPWLLVIGFNLGCRLVSFSTGEPLPPWRLYADTTWLVTRYWAMFCAASWMLDYVSSWFQPNAELTPSDNNQTIKSYKE